MTLAALLLQLAILSPCQPPGLPPLAQWLAGSSVPDFLEDERGARVPAVRTRYVLPDRTVDVLWVSREVAWVDLEPSAPGGNVLYDAGMVGDDLRLRLRAMPACQWRRGRAP